MTKLPIFVGIAALLVVLVTGMYTTDFTAYLGNDPSTCNNCHVMDGAYEGWYHAGHQEYATCADCHTPHSLIPKYYVKALSGYHHVTTFVFGEIPEAIRAKESSQKVVQENCIYCHEDTVEGIVAAPMPTDRYCWDCHRSVAHGQRGISLYPFQYVEESK